MKNLVIIFSLFISVFLLSCEDDQNESFHPGGNHFQSLTFNSFFPEQAQAGDDLILSVSNFNTAEHSTVVSIGNEVADLVAADSYTLVVKIPYTLSTGYYSIIVRSNGQSVMHDNPIFITGRQSQP